MVKSPLRHIVTALLLTLATATLPGPPSALSDAAVAASYPSRFTLLPELPSSPATASSAGSAPLLKVAGLPSFLAAADGALLRPDGAAAAAPGRAPESGSQVISANFPAPVWRWRRAGVADYLGVALLAGGAIYVETAHGDPEPRWRGRNGFDETVRDALRLDAKGAREAAHDVGDALMGFLIAAPVVDTFATLGIRDRAWDTLWQTEMVNLESFVFTSFVSSLLQNLVAREKPFVRNCGDGACEGGAPYRSMPSGHVAFAFTGAGLVCNHHAYHSLYRDPDLDRDACYTGMGLAVADGVARIMADHHYATDVLTGAAIGLFSGYLLPRLLHYDQLRPPTAKTAVGTSLLKNLSLRPQVTGSGAGLSCELRF